MSFYKPYYRQFHFTISRSISFKRQKFVLYEALNSGGYGNKSHLVSYRLIYELEV